MRAWIGAGAMAIVLLSAWAPAPAQPVIGAAAPLPPVEAATDGAEGRVAIEVTAPPEAPVTLRLPDAAIGTAGGTAALAWRFLPVEGLPEAPGGGVLTLAEGAAGQLVLTFRPDRPGFFAADILAETGGVDTATPLRLTRHGPEVDLSVADPAGGGEGAAIVVRARNRGKVPAVLHDPVFLGPGNTEHPARWRAVADDGAAMGDGPVTVNADDSADIAVAPDLPAPGRYRLRVSVRDGTGAPAGTAEALLVHGLGPIAADALAMEPKAALTLPFLGGLRSHDDRAAHADRAVLTARLHNRGAVPVVAGAVTAAPPVRAEGEDIVRAMPAPGAITVADGCAGATILPGASCDAVLHLPADLSAGVWRIAATATGAHGGASGAETALSVRLSAVWAFLTVVAGAFVGVAVELWRGSGRPALVLRARLAEVAEEAAALAGLLPPLGPAAQEIEAEALRRIRVQGHDPAAVTTAGDLAEHLGLLGGLRGLFARFDALDPVARRMLAGLHARAGEAVASGAAGEAEAQAADRLRRALNGIAPLLEAADRLRSGVETAERVEALLGGTSGDAATAARTALDAALAPLGAEDQASDRRDAADRAAHDLAAAMPGIARAALDRAAARLEDFAGADPETIATIPDFDARLAALRTRIAAARPAPTPDEAEGIAAEIRALGRDLGVREDALTDAMAAALPDLSGALAAAQGELHLGPAIFLPPPGTPARTLRAMVGRMDWITNAGAAVLFGLGAVLAVWAPDADWGTGADMLLLFLGGAAAKLVLQPTSV